ncbi:MAG: hypothetical protein WBM14_12140 [Terracidiphilus sp.]
MEKTCLLTMRYPVYRWRKADSDAGSGRNFDFRTLCCRFDFSNEPSANGILFREEAAPENAPATIVLNDKGYKASGDMVAPHVDRGEQVLALDPFFNGDQVPNLGA